MSNEPYILKYRKRPLMIVILIVCLLLFSVGTVAIYSEGSVIMSGLCVVLIVLMLFGLISQIILGRKPYHFMIDRHDGVLVIDNGLRKSSQIPLIEIRSQAISSQSVNHVTTHFLQFGVSPDFWSHYYGKNATVMADNIRDYEEMFIVIQVMNQKDEDLIEIGNYLTESGIQLVPFVQAVLGKYPGVPRENSHHPLLGADNQIVKKQRRSQLISYFCWVAFLLTAVMYLAIKLLGMFYGIFW